MSISTRRGRLLFAAMVAGLVAAVTIGWFTIVELSYRHDQELRDCARVVATRDDGRSMWTWVIDEFVSDNPAVHERVLDKLDELLPQLECDGTTPVPIKED